MFDYLSTATTALGSYAWTFLVVQGAALLAGIYLLAINQDTHPVRGPLLQRLGIALAILGGIGVLLGIARPLNLGILTVRWWFYVLALIELAFTAYVVYYRQSVYLPQMAAYRSSARSRRSPARQSAPTSSTSNGTPSAPPAPRPESITSRRAARRERKRRR